MRCRIATGDLRRDGEEELIQQVRLEQLTDEMRPTLAQDQACPGRSCQLDEPGRRR